MNIETRGTCSPSGIGNAKRHNSCLSYSELVTLGSVYNMFVDGALKRKDKDEKIMKSKIKKSEFTSPKKLYKALNLRFAPICGEGLDHCWIEQPLLKQNAQDLYKNLQKRFRPLMPSSWSSNKNHLLNTFDILKVVKQYEDKYKDFDFLGVYPLNFMEEKKDMKQMCVIGTICHFHIKKHIKNGKLQKKQFAIVHNMDPHDMPGSHWVSLYINIDPDDPRFGFSYYDSYGFSESYQVQKLYNKILEQLVELNMKVIPFYRNTKRNQYKNTECGMFSIMFIILCLENKAPIQDIYQKLNQPKADDMVASYRTKLFSKF